MCYPCCSSPTHRPMANRIDHQNMQLLQVKRFFKPLVETVGLDEAQTLSVPWRFEGVGENWGFVHSFESKSLRSQSISDSKRNGAHW